MKYWPCWAGGVRERLKRKRRVGSSREMITADRLDPGRGCETSQEVAAAVVAVVAAVVVDVGRKVKVLIFDFVAIESA